jgi:hypothetical protein
LWEDGQFGIDSSQVLLDPWQERVLWQRAVLESEESSELLQAGGAAATAQEAWALAAEWRLDLALVEGAGNEDSRMFVRWARHFQTLCKAGGLIDGAHLPDHLRSCIAQLRLPALVILGGFDEFTPQQRDFVEACRAAGCVIQPAVHEASRQAGETLRAAFADPSREIEAAARWARALLSRNPDVRIGVVVPDLSRRGREVTRVFRTILEPAAQLPGRSELPRLFHVSAGEPLSIRPLVASALLLLGLSPQTNEWDKVSELLLSPYIAGAVTERANRGLLDARMRRAGEMQVAMTAARRLCREGGCACPVLDKVLGQWIGCGSHTGH